MHEEIEMTTPQGETVKVDTGISELVQLLWDHGIRTRFSCEGHAKFVDQTEWDAKRYRAYIMMENDAKAQAFIAGLLVDSHFFRTGAVAWDIEFDTERDDGPRRMGNQTPNFNPRVTIRFPKRDIQPLVDYIRAKDALYNTIENDAFDNYLKEN